MKWTRKISAKVLGCAEDFHHEVSMNLRSSTELQVQPTNTTWFFPHAGAPALVFLKEVTKDTTVEKDDPNVFIRDS
jgi:hypothetical protein